mgnify:CR=1 FL=1|tara:strand:- start:3034 stop:3873 length:840 start_codon:yes stop_codon:yes gene_type:complete
MSETQNANFEEMCDMYAVLRNEDIKGMTEQKGRFDYLSWAKAWDLVKQFFPRCDYTVKRFPTELGGNKYLLPYTILPDASALVFVEIEIEDRNGDTHTTTMELAVTDNSNRSVKNPDSVQVQNTIRRCLAKGLSTLTGLGIELWAGEDIKMLDYKKETHITGDDIMPGMVTGEQSRKLNELMLKTECPQKNKIDIQKHKESGFKNLSEAEAQILITDTKIGIHNNKTPTKTRLEAVKKLLLKLDMHEDKKEESMLFLQGSLSNQLLDKFEKQLKEMENK